MNLWSDEYKIFLELWCKKHKVLLRDYGDELSFQYYSIGEFGRYKCHQYIIKKEDFLNIKLGELNSFLECVLYQIKED